jgi:hypothetical protein
MNNIKLKIFHSMLVFLIFIFSNAFSARTDQATIPYAPGIIIASYLDVDPNTKMPRSIGAYKIDLDSGSVKQIVADGGKVEAASPDGTHLLVYKPGDELLVTDLDGNTFSQVSVTFDGDSEFKQAYFSADSARVIFIAKDSETPKKGIYSTNLNGTEFLQISKPGTNPLVLFPSFNPAGVSWLKGTLNSIGIPKITGQRYTTLTGKESSVSWRGPTIWTVFSPNNTHVAFLPKMVSGSKNILQVSDLAGKNKVDLVGPKSPDKEMLDIYKTGKYWAYPLTWSPDGSQLLIHVYKQLTATDEYYIFDVRGNVTYRHLPLSWSAAWSPDGTQIAYFFNGSLNIFDLSSSNIVKTINMANGWNVTLFWIGNKKQ